MFPLGIFLANAGPMFEKESTKSICNIDIASYLSSIVINWVGYCKPFSFLLITVFSFFQVSIMFILFSSIIFE